MLASGQTKPWEKYALRSPPQTSAGCLEPACFLGAASAQQTRALPEVHHWMHTCLALARTCLCLILCELSGPHVHIRSHNSQRIQQRPRVPSVFALFVHEHCLTVHIHSSARQCLQQEVFQRVALVNLVVEDGGKQQPKVLRLLCHQLAKTSGFSIL